MPLKNDLIEVFKKASLEKNILLKEDIVLKWVHRFGIDSLNDLLIHSSALREYQNEKQNQERITLMDEVDEVENQEQITPINEVDEVENQELIKFELSKTFENIKQRKCESKDLEIYRSTGIFSKNQNSHNVKQLSDTQKLPLPNIKNLRKWINNDKKAS
mgnify:CR=1 FL=1